MYIERHISERLKKLVNTFPVVVVTGARQVGKSTLLRHDYGKKFDTVVFDPVLDIDNAKQDPELFLDNHPAPLILDEAQYVPELIPALKRRIDKNRQSGQYLITGSQQWGVLKTISESLAGRAVFMDLNAFSLAEINHQSPWLEAWLKNPEKIIRLKPLKNKKSIPLYEQLWRGFFPDAQKIPSIHIPDFYQSYLRTYVERDVRLMADISDLQLFGRFVRLTAAMTAQEINHSQLGRELGLTPQTSKRWSDILKAGFQWMEIDPFYGNVIKRISQKSKGYLTDTGLICNAQAISSPRAIGGHPLFGALFETAAAMDLLKQSSAMATPPHFYHWRSHGGAEVDILLELDGRYFPIEVKAYSQPSGRHLTGIKAFRETYPQLNTGPGLVIGPFAAFSALSKRDYAMPWDAVLA
ncbi:ATP-binding protein [Candidatus Peregrinibacteria bacterium]|nr:ATP-binding protein [Candidatus Peregrinibacteria bacterium]